MLRPILREPLREIADRHERLANEYFDTLPEGEEEENPRLKAKQARASAAAEKHAETARMLRELTEAEMQ